MPKQTYFDRLWLQDKKHEAFWPWLEENPKDKTLFVCRFCAKTDLKLSNMGVEALKSHASNKKHTRLAKMHETDKAKTQKLTSFFSPAPSSADAADLTSGCRPASVASCSDSQSSSCISETDHASTSDLREAACSASRATALPLYNDDDRVQAEIRWLFRGVETNQSTTSNEGISKCFSLMFPDSKIAQNFSLGDAKSRYVLAHGLAPYLLQLLKDKIRSDQFVLLFDESFNKKTQEKQMDIHIRFWNGNEVQTRYFTSAFLGHAEASKIVSELKEAVLSMGLRLEQMLQLGMDGPNVNWKVFTDLEAELNAERDTSLLNVGSCGLHVVHGAFKTAMQGTKWELEEILKKAYKLFDGTAARREDYFSVTGSDVFPFKFAAHRWLDNKPALERLIEVLPSLQKYVKAVRDKKIPDPGTHAFGVIHSEASHPLLQAKLQFALSITKMVHPFLTRYQSDHPLLPFITADLRDLIMDILRRFVDPKKIDELTSLSKLQRQEFAKPEHHIQVDLGFSAEQFLRSSDFKKRHVSETEVFALRSQAKAALITFVSKLLEKSPIAYPLARHLSCLIPANMCDNPEQCKKVFRRILTILVEKKRVHERSCDDVEREFSAFLHAIASPSDKELKKEDFREFDMTKDRLDSFLHERMCQKFPAVWQVVRLLLLLSHGQATVERGFSFNKQLVQENQDHDTVIARRLVKDHVNLAGGAQNVLITKAMLSYARSARQRYHQNLAARREAREKEEKNRKRKSEEEAVAELRAKKGRLQTDIDHLYKSVKALALKCEKTGNIAFVTESNACREKAEKKERELKAVNDKLDALKEQLKQ